MEAMAAKDNPLAAFIKAYVDEDAPACILSRSKDSVEIFQVTASNAAFTQDYEKQLVGSLHKLGARKPATVLSTKDIRWNLTTLPPPPNGDKEQGDRPGDTSTIVCIGRRREQNEPQTDSSGDISSIPADGTSQDPELRKRYDHTKQPLHFSVGRDPAEAWLQEWSKMELPGVDREEFLSHLDLIRKFDWAKTPLGPMDTWSIVLLSTLGQALASPFPVLLAWGPELTQIYNLHYSYNIAHKHPRNMGRSYADAWPEVWEYLIAPTNAAMNGKATHVNNAQMFLQRKDYLEECYFTWSMTPIFDDNHKVAGIYIPNFDNTLAVVTERRLKLLREASQAQGVETKPVELYRRICRATSVDPVDIPLLVFYDSSAADDEREMSEDSSEKLFEQTSQMDDGSHYGDDLRYETGTSRMTHDEHDIDENHASRQARLRVPSANLPQSQQLQRNVSAGTGPVGNDPDGIAKPPMHHDTINPKVKPLSEFVRAAYTGCKEHSKLFPATIPPPDGEEENKSIATHPIFLQALRKVQRTHQLLILHQEQLKDFSQYLDRTVLGDEITTIAIMPITTSDDTVRGICIIGLNPRKAYSEDYQVFLDLFQAQVNHGVTSIRLVGEELRRSRFFAALIKRKNEELHVVLDARTEELRNSEQKFVKMAEICPSGIWTVDHKGSVTFVNEAWYTITRHSRDRPLDEWPESIHAEDKARCEAWFANVLASRDPIHPIEFRWKPPPGERTQRWTWADARHDIGDNGELIAITGTLTDITEKKAVELYQQQRAEEAIQMRRAQEGFVDMTSHELRNPLSAISLSSDATTERLEHLLDSDKTRSVIMSMFKAEVEETLQDMKIINHCCVHMTRLIDDVLTLSKLDNQFLVITPVPCRPADFISETLAIFKGEMASKDIACELEIRPSFVANNVDYVLTDPSRINQLVINILTNAIKFTASAKTRHIKITLDCSPTKPTTAGISMQGVSPQATDAKSSSAASKADDIYLLVSISDTGRGLTQDEIGHLFQRFRQANPKTHISYGGSGLGLHICKRITELLGGEIGVESVRGRGSTFTFYIPTKRALMPHSAGALMPSPGTATLTGSSTTEDPMAKGAVAPRPARPLASPAEELGNAFEKLALLIVEDNLINQRLLDKHLTRVGCVTTCANHGQEAIDMIKQSKWVRSDGPTIDCVLMDIEMPVMDGLTAIQELRRMEQSGEIQGHIPVLAVTANARSEQLEIMLGSGFDGTISKPFKIPVIMDRVRTLLRNLRQQGTKRKAHTING